MLADAAFINAPPEPHLESGEMSILAFKMIKNHESTDEDFIAAISCVKTCIESALCDLEAMISIDDDKILVEGVCISEDECKKIIRGCFCSIGGEIYPEFLRIEILPIDK